VKYMAAIADTGGAIEHGPSGVELDEQGDDAHQRSEEQQRRGRDDDIQEALDGSVAQCSARRTGHLDRDARDHGVA
jgi:hypothetical protein